jgi:hypothetical protein
MRQRSKVEQPEVSIELAVDSDALVRERSPVVPSVGDLAFDARLLADYGEPHRNWMLWPLYAWRVLHRRRELRVALGVRREEALRTATEVDDALVAIAEQARPEARSLGSFQGTLQALVEGEALLRSRDQVFAAEQDAQNARLAQVDSRLRALEAELEAAQVEEQGVIAELNDAQAVIAREESIRRRSGHGSSGAERSGG